MGNANIPFDDDLAAHGALLRITALGGFSAGGVVGRDLTDIKFQFPLVIKQDNKGGDWKEINIRNSEPLAIFMGGKPREIDLSWTYIVSGQTHAGIVWTTDVIEKMVKTLRGYFYNPAGTSQIIQFQAYNIVGDGNDYWTFRSDGINVTHSEMLIKDANGIYPLRTDLSMRLKFLTTLAQPGGVGNNAGSNPSPDDQKMLIRGAKSLPGGGLTWL